MAADKRHRPPAVSWRRRHRVDDGEFVDNNNDERIVVGGTWLQDGSGALRITASHVFLDTLQAAFDRPTRYGGVLDPTCDDHRHARHRSDRTVSASNGGVERVSYQKLRRHHTGWRIDIDFGQSRPGT